MTTSWRELPRVVLRATVVVGVPTLLGLALASTAPEGSYGPFLALMGLGGLLCLAGAAHDTRRDGVGLTAVRWIAVSVLVGVGVGVGLTLLWPGSMPEERVAEATTLSLFFLTPAVAASLLGVLVGRPAAVGAEVGS